MITDANRKSPASRDAKRARFATQRSGASPWVLIAGLAAVLALVGGTIFALTRTSSANAAASSPKPAGLTITQTGSQGLVVQAATVGHAPYPLAEAVDGAIRVPLSTFDDGKAHFYTYMHEGKPLEFFVLRSSDGVVRAAFNACDVCYAGRKGYHQEGDEMVCNNCGNRFPSSKINDVRGGCNPSPLERTVDGDTLVIRVSDLSGGLFYFEG